jgi:hypothetical protein
MSDKEKIFRALDFITNIRGQSLKCLEGNVIEAGGRKFHFDDTDTLIFVEEG